MPWFGLVLLVLGLALPAQGFAADEGGQNLPTVVVAPVVSRDVSPVDEYVGRVKARETVQLQARVEGFLEQRKFTEGAMVKKGELLFVIEQAPFQAAVTQSEASVERTKATNKNDALNLKRQQELFAKGDVAQSTVDSATATETSSRAQVKDAEAALEVSKINLGYTEIHSPLDGRISTVNVDVGNLVGPSSGTLATVMSVDPVYVTLNPSATKILDHRLKGVIDGNKVSLVPRLKLSDGSIYPHPGKFDYVDISVQEGTDTVMLRAEFPNPDALLTPGQYLTVIVGPKESKQVLVVPQQAVQLEKSGRFALVVGADDKVERRNIEVGGVNGSDWVVTSGLKAGDRVVVGGLQKVSPGDKVKVASGGS